MAETLLQSVATAGREVPPASGEVTVYVRWDGVTPAAYLVWTLRAVFGLSDELAEHIAWVARAERCAPVVTRSRSVARRLASEGHIAARTAGYPLTFSLEAEPEQRPVEAAEPTPLGQFVLIVLLVLSALCLAVADGAGVAPI